MKWDNASMKNFHILSPENSLEKEKVWVAALRCYERCVGDQLVYWQVSKAFQVFASKKPLNPALQTLLDFPHHFRKGPAAGKSFDFFPDHTGV